MALKQAGFRRTMRAFTLVELLVVIAVIAILAALLFPVFATARNKGRQAVCVSNLRQVGMAVSMYAEDSNELYPYAIDPVDKFTPQIWNNFSDPQIRAFHDVIPQLPLVQEVLLPYAKSPEIFHCPADTGFDWEDFAPFQIDPNGSPKNASPTSFKKFGTSYYYRTEIAARQAGEASFQTPAMLNVLFDGAGKWHGSSNPLANLLNRDENWRYDVLFGDNHVKNLSRSQLDYYWSLPL